MGKSVDNWVSTICKVSRLQMKSLADMEFVFVLNRGSYMSAHVLLNLLNELGKRDKNARLAEHFISFSQQV